MPWNQKLCARILSLILSIDVRISDSGLHQWSAYIFFQIKRLSKQTIDFFLNVFSFFSFHCLQIKKNIHLFYLINDCIATEPFSFLLAAKLHDQIHKYPQIRSVYVVKSKLHNKIRKECIPVDLACDFICLFHLRFPEYHNKPLEW